MSKAKRKDGDYARPVMRGDAQNALIDRMDAHSEREQARSRVDRLYPEGGQTLSRAAGWAV